MSSDLPVAGDGEWSGNGGDGNDPQCGREHESRPAVSAGVALGEGAEEVDDVGDGVVAREIVASLDVDLLGDVEGSDELRDALMTAMFEIRNRQTPDGLV